MTISKESNRSHLNCVPVQQRHWCQHPLPHQLKHVVIVSVAKGSVHIDAWVVVVPLCYLSPTLVSTLGAHALGCSCRH